MSTATETISQAELDQLPICKRRHAVFTLGAEDAEKYELVCRMVEAIGGDILNGDFEGPYEIENEADHAILMEILRVAGGEYDAQEAPVAALEAARQVLRVATGVKLHDRRSRENSPEDTIVVTGNCHKVGDVGTLAAAAGLRVRQVERPAAPVAVPA